MIPLKNAVPSRYPPVVTWILIATNCLVFLFQNSLSPLELEMFLRDFALIPARYTAGLAYGELTLGAFVPMFTMMFLHGGWLHLIFNMWTLWLFGPTVEDRLGHGRYLAFYLACGLAASVAHLVFNPTSVIPAVGASGAIAGVLGCYMRLFPLARVIVLVPILFRFYREPSSSCCRRAKGALRGGPMSEGSSRDLCLAPYWYSRSGATRNTTPTKASSASTRQGAFD